MKGYGQIMSPPLHILPPLPFFSPPFPSQLTPMPSLDPPMPPSIPSLAPPSKPLVFHYIGLAIHEGSQPVVDDTGRYHR